MASERFLVTGALGCIGAWVVRNLVRDGVETTVLDAASNPHRLQLIMSDAELARVRFVTGDIADLSFVEQTVKGNGITHIVHLAALQVPFCKADPSLGARVNVVGTVNIFEAAKRAGIKHLAYASSIAVYGRSEEYGEGPVDEAAPLLPRTHYGVYKQANEGTARIYWWDEGVPSIGLRPYTVYGPGRDQGLTSSPTKAMLAAAAGQPYHIPFGGRSVYQYTDDTARIFIQAARADYAEAGVFNVPGSGVRMTDIIAAIEAAAPTAMGRITLDDKPLPFPEEIDGRALVTAIGALPYTPLDVGVAQTIEIFKSALTAGRINAEVK